MRGKHFIAACLCALISASCSNASLGRLVGSDRDEHGCVGSTGYTWSYALHDCVRVWEAGLRFETGPKQVYLIFSTDSAFAEIFTSDGKQIICKRFKNTNTWHTRKGPEQVTINNGVIRVYVDKYTYTHPQ